MKAMFLSVVAMVVITIGAAYALQQIGWSAAEQGTTSDNVRLD